MKNKIFKNNGMLIEVCMTWSRSVDKYDLAWVEMVSRGGNNNYIVVRGLYLDKDNGTCYWDYALEYDCTFSRAEALFYDKIQEYEKFLIK